jgi:hypothetical protein
VVGGAGRAAEKVLEMAVMGVVALGVMMAEGMDWVALVVVMAAGELGRAAGGREVDAAATGEAGKVAVLEMDAVVMAMVTGKAVEAPHRNQRTPLCISRVHESSDLP